MEVFPAFLVIIKTNFGKIITCFVDSKFDSTNLWDLESIGKIMYSNKQIMKFHSTF